MRWIFAHGDGDGVTSAALALAAVGEAEIFFTHPHGLYGDLRDNVKPGDDVIIVDIALNESHLESLIDIFSSISGKGEFIYIDHHPEPIGLGMDELPGIVVHDISACAAELTFRFFEDKLPWEYNRVALYGAIADYMADTPFARRALEDWDMRLIYFEAGVLSQGLEGSRKMYDFKRHVVKHLSENRLPSALSELLVRALIESVSEEEMIQEIKKSLKVKGNVAYVLNPSGSVSRAATYVRALAKTRIGLAGEVRKDTIIMSLRTNDEKIDLNLMLRELSKETPVEGGGHKRAAGARVPVKYFEEFIDRLNEEVLRIT
ncbi:MAG: DHH family phosphoesterase [Thermoprotei archaeon]|nr:DHH family phosphoesterase [Thermoprotei archaeon]